MWVWRSIHILKEKVGVVAEISLAEGLSFSRWCHIGILKKKTSLHFIFLPNHCRSKVHPHTNSNSHWANFCSELLGGSPNYVYQDSGYCGHILIQSLHSPKAAFAEQLTWHQQGKPGSSKGAVFQPLRVALGLYKESSQVINR